MRADARVRCIEKCNARELSADSVGAGFDLVVGDLSFISLTLVLPALVPLLRPDGEKSTSTLTSAQMTNR